MRLIYEPERCTHCGDASDGLIEDEWGAWHCLDRAGCLDRLTARLEAVQLRNRELTDMLERAERRCQGLEQVADAAIDACVGVARTHELSRLADELEAKWHRSRP